MIHTRGGMAETRAMRLVWWLLLAGCAGSGTATPAPVIPAIHDRMIAFGQRVGPVSLGMTTQQLVEAAGTVKATPYGGNRAGYLYPALALNVVIDDGRVVTIAPTDGSYATAAGIRVGANGAELHAVRPPAAGIHRGETTITYCYADRTLVTVGATATAGCAAGIVCDIVVGGCTPP